MRRRASRPALALLLLAIGGAPAAAATFTVDVLEDAFDEVCDAHCSLRDAVRAANVSPGADVIEVPAGVYVLAIPGTDEDQTATGDLDLRGGTTISGAGMGLTVIDAAGLDRAIDVTLASGGSFELRDLTVRGGRLAGTAGCGIRNKVAATLTLRRVELRDNRCIGDSPVADNGGGVHADGNGDLDVYESRIVANFAERGGGIYSSAQQTRLFDTTVAGNGAGVSGGGVAGGGSWVIHESTLSGNRGGAASFFGATDIVRIYASTITNNEGWAVRASGALSLDNVTAAGNHAFRTFEVVLAGASLELRNTIAVNTLLATGAECGGAGSVGSRGYNLTSDGSCGAATGDVVAADAGLGGLAWNGGPTRTRHPRPGSPVLDAGAPISCADSDGFVSSEQRGFARVVDADGGGGARCDIGAVEYAPEPGAGALAAAAALALAWRRTAERLAPARLVEAR